jgi:hypothetical protein
MDPVLGRFMQSDPLGISQTIYRKNEAGSTPEMWLDRHPRAQYGSGMNICEYAKSTPHLYVDPTGRDSTLITALSALAACGVCGKAFYNYANSAYPDKSDKWKHCYVSCKVASYCTTACAAAAGYAKELRDLTVGAAYKVCVSQLGRAHPVCEWLLLQGPGTLLDSILDGVADVIGIRCSRGLDTCRCCCTMAGL